MPLHPSDRHGMQTTMPLADAASCVLYMPDAAHDSRSSQCLACQLHGSSTHACLRSRGPDVYNGAAHIGSLQFEQHQVLKFPVLGSVMG